MSRDLKLENQLDVRRYSDVLINRTKFRPLVKMQRKILGNNILVSESVSRSLVGTEIAFLNL